MYKEILSFRFNATKIVFTQIENQYTLHDVLLAAKYACKTDLRNLFYANLKNCGFK